MQKIDWFGVRSGRQPLEQGLIVPDFKFPKLGQLPLPGKEISKEIKYDKYDAIILSQSCDLSGKNVDYIQICPVDTLNAIFSRELKLYPTAKARAKLHENFSKDRFVNQHILNKFSAYDYRRLKTTNPGSNFDASINRFKEERLVATFSESVVVPRDYLKYFIKSRNTYLMLNPPYREALAQRFGLYFMRVGNPKNISLYDDSEFNNKN
jgi:hypothetical protein